MFITPIVSGVLGPTAQDLLQKLGNYLSATVLARIKGLLTNSKADKNRPVVLIWMIIDLVKKAKAMVEKALAMAKEMADLLQSRMDEISARKAMEAADKIVGKDAMKASSELAAAAAQAGGGGSGSSSASGSPGSGAAPGERSTRSPSEHEADANEALNAAGDAADAAVTAAEALSRAAADQAALMAQAGIAAAATRNAALQAARAAANAQVASQGPSIPTLEKAAFASSAAAAARTVALARSAAEEAQVAAMLAATHTVSLARQAASAAALAADAADAAAAARRRRPPPRPPVGDIALPAAPLPLQHVHKAESLDAESSESLQLVELAAWAAAVTRSGGNGDGEQADRVHPVTPQHEEAAGAARHAAAAVASAVLVVHAVAEAVGDCSLVEAEGMPRAAPADLDVLTRGLPRGPPRRHAAQGSHAARAPSACFVAGSVSGAGGATAFVELLGEHVVGAAASAAATDRPLPPGRAGVFHAAKLVSDAVGELEMANAAMLGHFPAGHFGWDPIPVDEDGDDITASDAAPPQAGGAGGPPRFAAAHHGGRAHAAVPPRGMYMEVQPMYIALPAIPKKIIDILSHVLTSVLSNIMAAILPETLFASLEGALTVKLKSELPGLVARAAVAPLTLGLHESIKGSLVPSLTRSLTTELSRSLPPALLESLTRSVAHGVTQAIAATAAHTAAGVESEPCAHCLHTASGGGACDAVCWSSSEAHEAGDAAARGAHAAAAYFSDYYAKPRKPDLAHKKGKK